MRSRGNWSERVAAGVKYRELAAEARTSVDAVGRWLRKRGIYSPNASSGEAMAPPQFFEAMIMVYPDAERQDWMRQQLAPWRREDSL